MTQDEVLKLALEALENNKLNHLYCEDTWYSCPKHEDGCANEAEGDECNCGADEVNAQFDNAITAIKEALAQPEQEPVDSEEKAGAYMEARLWEFIDMAATWPKASPDPRTWDHVMVYAPKPAQQEPVAIVESVATVVSESGNQKVTMSWWHEPALPVGTKLHTTPPQRTWVGLTDEEMTHAKHHMVEGAYQYSFKQGAKWAEAKLKQKNGYAEEKNT